MLTPAFSRAALLAGAMYLLNCEPLALPSLALWRGSRGGPAIHTPF
jgi:hypothetical protein